MTDAVVRAPISGTVSKRHVQPGEKVAFDAPLLSIVDLAQLEVQAQVPVSDVTETRGWISEGPATVTVAPGNARGVGRPWSNDTSRRPMVTNASCGSGREHT